jgi:hypothetical protein
MSDLIVKEKLDSMRGDLASAQLIDVGSEGLDPERVKKLYWAIEDALTQVKALQASLEEAE